MIAGEKPDTKAVPLSSKRTGTLSIVFWNLNAYDNVPVRFDERGTALVSGFSPAIMKSILESNYEDMTPEAMMLKAVSSDRYAL
jgi:hypothetical protein